MLPTESLVLRLLHLDRSFRTLGVGVAALQPPQSVSSGMPLSFWLFSPSLAILIAPVFPPGGGMARAGGGPLVDPCVSPGGQTSNHRPSLSTRQHFLLQRTGLTAGEQLPSRKSRSTTATTLAGRRHFPKERHDLRQFVRPVRGQEVKGLHLLSQALAPTPRRLRSALAVDGNQLCDLGHTTPTVLSYRDLTARSQSKQSLDIGYLTDSVNA